MVKYLFRGKRKDSGEWVFGYYVVMAGKDYIYVIEDAKHYEIISETLGQWSQLTDKYGTKIFEGDIYKTQPYRNRPYSKTTKTKQHIGLVEYLTYKWNTPPYNQTYNGVWRVKIKDYDGYNYSDWSEFYQGEVIGNIHDNPELLEDKQNG